MGEKERKLTVERLKNLQPNERLFRINAGMGWTGSSKVRKGKFLIIENPYPLHAAPEGWPDLVGFESVIITPDMVGKKVAIFKGVEIKATGKLSIIQEKFKNLIERMGGIFEIVK